jgi:surface antigen
VLVKSLAVITISLSLGLFPSKVSADTRIPLSATGGVRSDYNDPSNAIAIFGNMFKQVSGSLSRRDTETHIRTVIFAASTLPTGEIAEWYNPDTGSGARIKVVFTKPVQGGQCRMLFTEVEKRGKVREYTEYACKTIDSQFWTFSAR